MTLKSNQTAHITIRVPKELKKQIIQECERQERTVSQFIRFLLSQYFKNKGEENT